MLAERRSRNTILGDGTGDIADGEINGMEGYIQLEEKTVVSYLKVDFNWNYLFNWNLYFNWSFNLQLSSFNYKQTY